MIGRPPKLVAIDVDGTLIDSESRLPPEVTSAVGEAMEMGVEVVLATGRMLSAAANYIESLRLHRPGIGLNGTIVGWHDDREPIYHNPIPREVSEQILSRIWDRNATIVDVDRNRAFGRNITDLTGPALSSWIVNIEDFPARRSAMKMESTALLVAGDKGEIESIRDELRLDFEELDVYFFPSIRYFPMHYLEIRAAGTSKGNGLRRLVEHLDAADSGVMAIGDYLNDISMAEVADIFAAPASAHESVLRIADYVSPLSNDQGAVSDILKRFVLDVKEAL